MPSYIGVPAAVVIPNSSTQWRDTVMRLAPESTIGTAARNAANSTGCGTNRTPDRPNASVSRGPDIHPNGLVPP